MGYIIVLLSNLLAGAIAWIVERYSAKMAMALILIAAFTAAWAIMTAAIWAALSAAALTLPTGYTQLFFFLPSSLPSLISARISLDFAVAFYKYTKEGIKIKAYIT